jgi:hypothetical protein
MLILGNVHDLRLDRNAKLARTCVVLLCNILVVA